MRASDVGREPRFVAWPGFCRRCKQGASTSCARRRWAERVDAVLNVAVGVREGVGWVWGEEGWSRGSARGGGGTWEWSGAEGGGGTTFLPTAKTSTQPPSPQKKTQSACDNTAVPTSSTSTTTPPLPPSPHANRGAAHASWRGLVYPSGERADGVRGGKQEILACLVYKWRT